MSRRFYVPEALDYTNSMEALNDHLEEAERLAVLMEQDDVQSERVLQLVMSAEDFAVSHGVAGPDVPAVSCESFAGWLATVIQNLLQWLKRMVGYITSSWNNINLGLKAIEFNTNNLMVNTSLSPSNFKNPTFTVSKYVPSLCVLYRAPLNIGAVITNLNTLHKTLKAYFDWQAKMVTTGRGLMQDIKGLQKLDDIRRVEQTIRGVMPDAKTLKLEPLHDDAERIGSAPLPGSRRLVLEGYVPSDTAGLSQFADMRFVLDQALTTQQKLPRSVTMSHFNQQATDQCLSTVLEITKLLKPHFSGEAINKRKALIHNLEQAVQQLGSRASQLGDGTPASKANTQQLLATLRKMSELLREPYTDLGRLSLNAMRGAYIVCAHNRKG